MVNEQQNLDDAIAEAKRFLKKAIEFNKSKSYCPYLKEITFSYQSSKRSSMKRASMDLTRSLAKLRSRSK